MSFRQRVFDAKVQLDRHRPRELYRELIENQRRSPDELAALQRDRLRSITRFAATSTEFYAKRFAEAGIAVEDLDDPDTFTSLPMSTKADLKDNWDAVRSTEASSRTSRLVRTGGSTGMPTATLLDTRFPNIVLAWRMRSWWGINPWDDTALLNVLPPTGPSSWLYLAKWWPTRRFGLNVSDVDDESVARFMARMAAIRPPLLEGFVGSVAELAEYVDRAGLTVTSPVAISVTAAPLTAPTRRRIEEVFGAPVYDQYRCVEVPWMAGECREQDGLHVFTDYRHIEIVDEHGTPVADGEQGDVLVTDLSNRVFPIIRYRLGDRGRYRPGTCACGVTLPRLESPDGRTVDMLHMPDGSAMTGGLTGIFGHRPDAVHQFQIHQAADYSIRVRVVRGPAPDAAQVVSEVADKLRARGRGQVPVTVEFVDEIKPVRGKLRFIISDAPATPPPPTTSSGG